MNPEVLHIVVVYNGLKWLPELLESVRASNTGEVWAMTRFDRRVLGVVEGQFARGQQGAGSNLGFGLGNN